MKVGEIFYSFFRSSRRKIDSSSIAYSDAMSKVIMANGFTPAAINLLGRGDIYDTSRDLFLALINGSKVDAFRKYSLVTPGVTVEGDNPKNFSIVLQHGMKMEFKDGKFHSLNSQVIGPIDSYTSRSITASKTDSNSPPKTRQQL